MAPHREYCLNEGAAHYHFLFSAPRAPAGDGRSRGTALSLGSLRAEKEKEKRAGSRPDGGHAMAALIARRSPRRKTGEREKASRVTRYCAREPTSCPRRFLQHNHSRASRLKPACETRLIVTTIRFFLFHLSYHAERDVLQLVMGEVVRRRRRDRAFWDRP